MHDFTKLTDSFWDNEYKNNRAWHDTVAPAMPWFGAALKYKAASRILDIGCGCGRNSLYLGKMGFSVTGVDLNGTGLQQAGEQVKLHNLANIGFVRGSAVHIPFRNDFFDGIVCLFTLNILSGEQRKQAILEMQRVLNKEGKLCLAEYVNEDLSEEGVTALLEHFTILGSWYNAVPLLAGSSPPLKTLCIVAEL